MPARDVMAGSSKEHNLLTQLRRAVAKTRKDILRRLVNKCNRAQRDPSAVSEADLDKATRGRDLLKATTADRLLEMVLDRNVGDTEDRRRLQNVLTHRDVMAKFKAWQDYLKGQTDESGTSSTDAETTEATADGMSRKQSRQSEKNPSESGTSSNGASVDKRKRKSSDTTAAATNAPNHKEAHASAKRLKTVDAKQQKASRSPDAAAQDVDLDLSDDDDDAGPVLEVAGDSSDEGDMRADLEEMRRDLGLPSEAEKNRKDAKKRLKALQAQQKRRNRMGQRARRALAEKIYGEAANHIKKGRQRQPAGPKAQRPTNQRANLSADALKQGGAKPDRRRMERQKPQTGAHSQNFKAKRQPKVSAQPDEKLHPSWQAKKSQQAGITNFKGTRVVFSDDE